LIVSLPLLRPFSDSFVLQAALLDPPIDEECKRCVKTAKIKFIWAAPTLAATEIKMAQARAQMTAAATWTLLDK
jgi:hypothetical protein